MTSRHEQENSAEQQVCKPCCPTPPAVSGISFRAIVATNWWAGAADKSSPDALQSAGHLKQGAPGRGIFLSVTERRVGDSHDRGHVGSKGWQGS